MLVFFNLTTTEISITPLVLCDSILVILISMFTILILIFLLSVLFFVLEMKQYLFFVCFNA